MDTECVSLLPRVCEVLADSARSLPDDTTLEKLLDWFTGFTKAGGSLLEACPCLLEFVSTVVYNTTSDPSVLSFTLRLTGLMAASEDGFIMLQEYSVLDLVFKLQHWQEAGLWDDPCIRIGWIQGLWSMLQHPKALTFFVQSDFIEPLLQLQTDRSIFVASAANQMLAHILLFFQPPLSAGCNGIGKKDGDDKRTHASITDLDQPAITLENRAEYAAVVTAILEYLKESLVPKENTQLHQSLQLLKLLSLLLTQARSPLRDMLLQTVAGSLEELVTTGYSQLTVPLMDVILAIKNNEKVNGLLFIICVTLSVNIFPAGDEHHLSMVEQLKSKTLCIPVVCCLSFLQPADFLPCPPVTIVTAVLSLLRVCSGHVSSSCTGCTEVFRNVIGSGKVQRCALDALTAFSCSPGLSTCEKIPKRALSVSQVLHKSYQALVKWTCVCKDLSSIKDQLRQDLIRVVKKRVCDMRWEVRDSTVEFLGKAAGVLKSAKEEHDVFEALLGGCSCTTPLLKEALQDPESYVRASAISALAQTLAHSWHQGAALTQDRLLEILSQDTEGFARRAVIQFFITWFLSCSSHSPPSSSTSSSSSSLLMNSVHSILSLGSTDLDWEVKVHTLELAELLLDEAFSGHRDLVSALSGLVELGVISVLLSGLFDCDRPVGLKACQLLITLRETVCPLSLEALDATTAMATVARVSCELPGWGWGQEIRKIVRMKKNDRANEMAVTGADEVCSKEHNEAGEHSVSEGGESVCVGVCEVLRSLGLDERLGVLTQSSDHVHNSPLSLLQDILTASAAHAHPDTQPGQEVIVDCY
uniref:BRCA1-associated ATM activator 1 n=1 Tax=Monopterus albus TaxID=43700 RepID=A0A3Q3IS08_MONAL